MTGTRRGIVRFLWTVLIGFPLLLAAVYALNPLGAQSMDPRMRIVGHVPYRVSASSMAPALKTGQVVIARVVRPDAPLQRGDVVTRHVRESPGNVWLQRIVGLPGETLAIEDGRVLINGVPLDEPYVDPERATTDYSRHFDPVRIPPDHFFMLGDNRDNSEDSRLISMARRQDIIGRVIVRIQ